MSVVQTVLVFVVIPVAVIGLVGFGVYGKTLLQAPNRYRPGKAWSYGPSWFVPHPDAVVPARAHAELPGATGTTAVGGASGEW